MKNVNKILILFLIIITTTLFAMWEFVQSEYFASKLSKKVTEYTEKYLDADLRFEKVNFKFFPPGVEIQNVSLKKESQQTGNLYTRVKKLGVEFNPVDLFKTDLMIDRVYLFDGFIRYSQPLVSPTKETSPSRKLDEVLKDIKITQLINGVKSKLPFFIHQLELNKINVTFNENSLMTHRLKLFLLDNSLNIGLTLRDFDLNKIQIIDEVLDEVSLNIQLYDDVAIVNKLEASKQMNKVALQGRVTQYLRLDELSYELTARVQGHLGELHNYFKFKEVGELRAGYAEASLIGQGNFKDFSVEADVEMHNIDTTFVSADHAELALKITQDNIVFNKFNLKAGNGTLELENPFEFYNFDTSKFVEQNINVRAQKLSTTNALKYLEGPLGIMQGELTGKIEFILEEQAFYFKINKGLLVEKLKVQTDKKSAPVLDIEAIEIQKGYFDIIKNDVFIGLDLKLGPNLLSAKGIIKRSKVKFEVKNATINLHDLGKIAGFDIRGETDFNLKVISDKKQKKLTLDTSVSNFFFEGFHQDRIKTKFSINFLDNSLSIRNIEALTGQTKTSGNFRLSLNDLSVSSTIRQSKIIIADLKRMYSPIFEKTKLPDENAFGDWEIAAQISGRLNLKDLNVKGVFVGYNNYVFGESIDVIKTKYSLSHATFHLEDMLISKPKGRIRGGLRYNINKEESLFWGNINKVSLLEINSYNKLPFTLNGELNGLFKGNFSNTDKSFSVELNINKSKIHNEKVGDSYIKVDLKNNHLNLMTSLLGNQLMSKGVIDLNKTKENQSSIDWHVSSSDLNKTLSVFSFVDHLKTGFLGEIQLQGNLLFNPWDFHNFSGKLNVKKIKVQKGLVDVNFINKESSQLVVENGKIKKWNLNVRGNNFYVTSRGDGDFKKQYDVNTRVKIDATLLEVLNVLIAKASGTLLASIHNFKKDGREDYVTKVVSSNLSINSDLIPLTLAKGELLLNYKNNKIILKKLKGQLNTGTFALDGLVDISSVVPDINIRYEFKNAGIPLLKKSTVSFSGKGSLVGKTIPYSLGGEIQVEKCSLVNEITEFAGGEDVAKSDIDYLPQDKSTALNQFLNFNITVNTIEPVRITNSMANLGLSGSLLLTGGEKDPRLSGKIGLAPIQNQIFFKNNTFTLNKGNIFFYERNKITNPELDFQANSLINKYNITISVLGPVSDFKLGLQSDPVLSQSDILSLVAFGYTEDLSTNLSDSEKESMTRAGVGSIIFDRFKINETLKNEFGLQVNLGTEISQDQGSYLSQRDAQGGDIGRVRSATTIEIKKQISEAVGLSVLSTVGGTVGQKQIMNLNYNLNKNLSIEGVYQSNTESQSAENLNNDSSLGADVKIRWSFR